MNWQLILLWVAVICFLIAALAPIFEWKLAKFNAIAWGLAAFAGSFLVTLI